MSFPFVNTCFHFSYAGLRFGRLRADFRHHGADEAHEICRVHRDLEAALPRGHVNRGEVGRFRIQDGPHGPGRPDRADAPDPVARGAFGVLWFGHRGTARADRLGEQLEIEGPIRGHDGQHEDAISNDDKGLADHRRRNAKSGGRVETVGRPFVPARSLTLGRYVRMDGMFDPGPAQCGDGPCPGGAHRRHRSGPICHGLRFDPVSSLLPVHVPAL